MIIEGFVIVGPISPWDEKYRDEIIASTSYGFFGRTEAEAWRRFIGPMTRQEYNDKSIFGRKVSHFFDRGYRVKKATLEIHDH